MSNRQNKKHRRSTRMHLRSRGKFKVVHKSKSGRTGWTFAKKLGGFLARRAKMEATDRIVNGVHIVNGRIVPQ